MGEYKTYQGVEGRSVAVRPNDVIAVVAQNGITRLVVGSDPAVQLLVTNKVESIWNDFDHCWMRGPSTCFSPNHIIGLKDEPGGVVILLPGGAELSMPNISLDAFARGIDEGRAQRKLEGFKN